MNEQGQITILLVDNDYDRLSEHASYLQEIGLFNHLQAENGSEALAMVRNFGPNLIIAENDISEINGVALLKLIRQRENEDSDKSCFVLYGKSLDPKMLAQAGRAGANMVFATPCSEKFFKTQIMNALNPPVDPKDQQADELFQKSVKLMEEKAYEEALETCKSILDIHESAEVYFNMGYIKSLQGEYEQAIECFKKATNINGQHAKAFQQMGIIYKAMGDPEEAQVYLEKAAEIHIDQNHDDEAEEIFNTVLSLKPDTTNVYNSLGIIYRRQGRIDESIKAYEKAIKVNPNDEHIYFNAARAYIDAKNILKAQENLKKAIELNPEFTVAIDLLRATELGLNLK